MLLVLAHSWDGSARWAADRLRTRSDRRAELVLVESLGAASVRWRHELGHRGVETEIQLENGRHLRSGGIRAVLNRVIQPPVAGLGAAVPEDAEYARSELTAFAISWIRALAPIVVNQPTPQGLSGRWRAPLCWRALAAEAGLPVAQATFDSDDPASVPLAINGEPSTTVLIIGGEALARGLPSAVQSAIRRFAGLARTPILGVRFAGLDPARHGWRMLDATPNPDLSSAGDSAIKALERLLA